MCNVSISIHISSLVITKPDSYILTVLWFFCFGLGCLSTYFQGCLSPPISRHVCNVDPVQHVSLSTFRCYLVGFDDIYSSTLDLLATLMSSCSTHLIHDCRLLDINFFSILIFAASRVITGSLIPVPPSSVFFSHYLPSDSSLLVYPFPNEFVNLSIYLCFNVFTDAVHACSR